MWSGLLPPGLRESDLSEDGGDEEETPSSLSGQEAPRTDPAEPGCPPGVSDSCFRKFLDLREKRCELTADTKRPERRRRRKRWRGKCKTTVEGNQETISSPPPVQSAALEALQPYFGADDRFEPPVCKKIIKKSRLEEELDGAVRRGDVETAESLSDRLATREMAVKITKAASCYNFIKAKEQEEVAPGDREKRRNLGWGFEAKKRWETKSNMGYM